MKTAEEILKSKGIDNTTKHHSYEYVYKSIIESMEEYASLKVAEAKQLPTNNVTDGEIEKMAIKDTQETFPATRNTTGLHIRTTSKHAFIRGIRKGLSLSPSESKTVEKEVKEPSKEVGEENFYCHYKNDKCTVQCESCKKS